MMDVMEGFVLRTRVVKRVVVLIITLCGGIDGLRGVLLMKEGLPERLKLVYGWHSVAGPGGPVRSDVGLDE
jgi:hypothetical protein